MKFAFAFLSEIESYSEKSKEIYTSYIKKQRKKIIEEVIARKDAAALSGIISLKLIDIKSIDDFIEKTNREKAAELLAILMDYKNRSFTAEEVEKEETRKINKKLNRDPMSPAVIREKWSSGNLPDGTVVLRVYKGNETEITVPAMIGKKKITVLGDHVFSPYQGGAQNKNKDVRGKITSVTIPEGVTKIGKNAFSGCRSLTSVTIPGSVTEIGEDAFSSCRSLSSVVIPNSVTEIGDRAFCGCGLTSVIIPDSVTKIGTLAFYQCSSLSEINVDENNRNYSLHDGTLYSKDRKKLMICLQGRSGSYVIPEGVTEIADRAFQGCSSLTGATIPGSVTKIGKNAFLDCDNLTLRAPAGSYAEQYAKENDIDFEPIK